MPNWFDHDGNKCHMIETKPQKFCIMWASEILFGLFHRNMLYCVNRKKQKRLNENNNKRRQIVYLWNNCVMSKGQM